MNNAGPSTATAITVTDVLDPEFAFVSSRRRLHHPSGQTVTCPEAASLAPGATLNYNLRARILPSYTGTGGDVINQATVTSVSADPNLADNTTSVALPAGGVLAPQADISVVKGSTTRPDHPGHRVRLHFTVNNAGPSTATQVTITDTLPATLHFVSSPDGCTAVGPDGDLSARSPPSNPARRSPARCGCNWTASTPVTDRTC